MKAREKGRTHQKTRIRTIPYVFIKQELDNLETKPAKLDNQEAEKSSAELFIIHTKVCLVPSN